MGQIVDLSSPNGEISEELRKILDLLERKRKAAAACKDEKAARRFQRQLYLLFRMRRAEPRNPVIASGSIGIGIHNG